METAYLQHSQDSSWTYMEAFWWKWRLPFAGNCSVPMESWLFTGASLCGSCPYYFWHSLSNTWATFIDQIKKTVSHRTRTIVLGAGIETKSCRSEGTSPILTLFTSELGSGLFRMLTQTSFLEWAQTTFIWKLLCSGSSSFLLRPLSYVKQEGMGQILSPKMVTGLELNGRLPWLQPPSLEQCISWDQTSPFL